MAIYKSNMTVTVLVQTATSLTLLAVTFADAERKEKAESRKEKGEMGVCAGRKSTSLRATVGSVAIYKSNATVSVLVQTATSLTLLAVT